jgi:hypothetical protein
MSKQITVSDELHARIQELVAKNKSGQIARDNRDIPGATCSLENQFSADGEFLGTECIGECGGLNRLLGRSCVKVQRNLPNGGFAFSCQCQDGWWDRLLGRST